MHPSTAVWAVATAAIAMAIAVDAAGAQDRAQDGTLASCADKIRAVLAEISARDLDTTDGPPLNAFLALNPNAIAQAEALDRAAAAGAARGPLFCVPVAVKDNFDTYDMPTTTGSLALIGNQPPSDAPFVARLRQAGAIIVGKTNMDEFAMGIRGLSGAGGRVGNAYDTAQSAGGSSAGSGTAVGAGYVPLAVGSDNCGSLRLPAVYNGAVTLRATYGRFNNDGIFPIGFVNGVPGVIAHDTGTLRKALAIAGDGWRANIAGGLRGKRIGVLRRFGRADPQHHDIWALAQSGAQKVFATAIALLRDAGAEIIDNVALDDFDPRLGPQFLSGFARKVDLAFAAFPGVRKNWVDVCTSNRIRPEWSAKACIAAGSSDARQERRVVEQIGANQHHVVALLDRLRLDALLYPADGRGGAHSDESPAITCFIAGASGLPAAAFPVGLDDRGLPVGLELLGRPQADETVVAMMAAFEAARGPLPQAKRGSGRADLAALDIARQNDLHLRLGWRAFHSRRGDDLGALAPEKFRALTTELVQSALAGR